MQIWKMAMCIEKVTWAPIVFLSLEGKAREAVLKLDIAALNSEDGMEKVIEKLDTLFFEDINLSDFLAYETLVAERISYFCLARNLIRPLGSTHIFTQSGWHILFSPDHLSRQHQIGESRQTLFLPQNFFLQGRRNDCLLSSIAAAPPPWGKLAATSLRT